MDKLNIFLVFLEENIDLEHEKEKEDLHLAALDFKEIPYLPLQIAYPSDDNIETYPYKEAFDEPEKMLYNELTMGLNLGLGVNSVYNSVKLKDHFPLHIRSNHGIGLMSSLFGTECKIINDNLPWVEHFENIEQVRDIINNGTPEFNSPLLRKVIADYRFFNQKLKEYPKCYKAIKITQPDMQGPFDIAHFICGNNIFYYLTDYPEEMHRLLDLITNTYIKLRKYFDSLDLFTDKAGRDSMYVHGAIYKGNVIIKDDTAMVSLSEEMYKEFVKPYNEKIIKAFGVASYHICGQSRDWHIDNIIEQGISSINYGNPELIDLNIAYEKLKMHKIPIVMWGWGNQYDFLKEVFNIDIKTGMTLSIKTDSYDNAKKLLEKHVSL